MFDYRNSCLIQVNILYFCALSLPHLVSTKKKMKDSKYQIERF